jgi:hypothetical protein
VDWCASALWEAAIESECWYKAQWQAASRNKKRLTGLRVAMEWDACKVHANRSDVHGPLRRTF